MSTYVPPKRLSQTPMGKRAEKWAEVVSYYPALDNLLDALYDEATDEQGRPFTTDNPERLERVHKQIQKIRETLNTYKDDPDKAVVYWTKELLKHLDGEMKSVYEVKHHYLTKKFENMKARMAEKKQGYEEGIKRLPVTEKQIDDNLSTLKRIQNFSAQT